MFDFFNMDDIFSNVLSESRIMCNSVLSASFITKTASKICAAKPVHKLVLVQPSLTNWNLQKLHSTVKMQKRKYM